MPGRETWVPPQTNLDSSKPLYEQFEDIVRSSIARADLVPGQRLPSVRDFAAHFRVNPNTVMRAYQNLEREGFLVTFRGQGTFIAKDERVIERSRRALARAALYQLQRVAASMGMSVDELLSLASKQQGDEE
ncbi:GntR family transcriptional regulator [Alicyclobacillus sp. SO9]|uniref:GntR family transcriptional regulator n=1 Tax=Alicyclobacillus sp. SO9 TaxID=2665646 RepID=UPI0018E7CAE0|nr:GntR family transcriptional regulator [Alicyclobacillus sp. SO9]QQE78893.1 GntR family transcriptional regulator [Alicyclobacillus sp. SO9]